LILLSFGFGKGNAKYERMKAVAKLYEVPRTSNQLMLDSLKELQRDEARLLKMLPRLAEQPRAMQLAVAAAVYELDIRSSALQSALTF
jgi:hypothetical protein